MDSYSDIFEGLQDPPQPGTSKASEQPSQVPITHANEIITELKRLTQVVTKLMFKVDRLEEHMQKIEQTQRDILKTSVLSTLPHHSQVVLNPQKGAPGLPTPRPKIM